MREVMKGLEAVLTEAGFKVETFTPATHSLTLSAIRGEVRAVLHITDRVEVPYRSLALEQAPQASLLMKAGLPGMTPAVSTGQQAITGAGAAVAANPENAARLQALARVEKKE